jgi:uncharacterized protein YbjT (DUF2867 family)
VPEFKRVLVAGATGYVGRFVVRAFLRAGFEVRVVVRDKQRRFEPGPCDSPALDPSAPVDVFVGELTAPETLAGLMDDVDLVFSSVGISRQRDGLTFEQVDYACNRTLIDLAVAAEVKRFTYVSMQGAENIMQLAITQAHERVVAALRESGLEYRVVRPCGYFGDMRVLLEMAEKGRVYLVGKGENKMTPIYGGDLADVIVRTALGDELEVEAGGPELMTQREAAELAFDVVGRAPKITVVPMWLARVLVRLIRLLSKQYGDLADFIVTAGEIDGVGPMVGTTTLRSYFEELKAQRQLAGADDAA